MELLCQNNNPASGGELGTNHDPHSVKGSVVRENALNPVAAGDALERADSRFDVQMDRRSTGAAGRPW